MSIEHHRILQFQKGKIEYNDIPLRGSIYTWDIDGASFFFQGKELNLAFGLFTKNRRGRQSYADLKEVSKSLYGSDKPEDVRQTQIVLESLNEYLNSQNCFIEIHKVLDLKNHSQQDRVYVERKIQRLEIDRSDFMQLVAAFNNPDIAVSQIQHGLRKPNQQAVSEESARARLTTALNYLYLNVINNLATPQEQQLWQEIIARINKSKLYEISQEAAGYINELFSKKYQPSQHNQHSVQRLQDEMGQLSVSEQKQFLRQIERRDPNLRDEVNRLLDEIAKKEELHDLPVNNNQLTRAYPQIKLHFIKWAEDNGYVTLDRRRKGDHHPGFNEIDIIILHYLQRVDPSIGFNPRLAGQLKKIIAEEIEKRRKK